jgi:hypothetical protein
MSTISYEIRNTPLPPLSDGRPLREGGKFYPIRYPSNESFSQALSAEQFKAVYGDDMPSDCGSVLELYPPRFSTGLRRDFSAQADDETSERTHGSLAFVLF